MNRAGVAQERRPDQGGLGLPLLPWLVAGGVALCAAYTLVIVVIPGSGFAHRSPELQAGIETASAVIAVIAAYLVIGRYALSGRLPDLALVAALYLLALTGISFSTVPALQGTGANELSVWAPTAGRLLSALGFAVAAFAPDLPLASPRHWGAGVLVACLTGITALFILALVFDSSPPDAFGPPPDASWTPHVDGPAGYLAAQLATTILFGAAVVGFAIRSLSTRDELVGWFAVGSVLAAFSSLNLFLFSRAQSDWVYNGDALSLGFIFVLLVGALRQIREYQRQVALSAVLVERRRLARDLHDGLAQELAFILAQSRRVATGSNGERTNLLADAAERALDESRSAIRALTRRSDDPFDVEVAQVVELLGGRAGARVRLELDPDVHVPAGQRDELLRILREAVLNGVRHGRASEIAVELQGGGGLRLAVRDNGAGFDPGRPRHGGFGLTSMRERTEALGGRLEITSAPGEGTLVEVMVP